jgi:tripartite-type tricarboxylate transporter receptor subunit TctC
MKIRTAIIAAFSLLAFSGTLVHSAENAQSFPSKPIRIIVPYSPGGASDMLSRIVGKHLTEVWKQPVVVENKPGVNGMLGADLVAKAAPDGYTLGMASPGTHAANATLYPKITYDTIKDFTPVTLAVSAPLLLVAHPSLNVKNVRELIAVAKAKPGQISYASGGSGSSQHLAMELFNSVAGLQMTHIPYKGSSASYVDLVGGRVSLAFDGLPNTIVHSASGKLVPLAIASSSRVPQLPNVPTVAESGLPGFESSAWYGFVAPGNMPKDILAKLNGEIVKALRSPEVADTMNKAGLIVVAGTPEEFAAHIKTEMGKAEKIIRTANIKID